MNWKKSFKAKDDAGAEAKMPVSDERQTLTDQPPPARAFKVVASGKKEGAAQWTLFFVSVSGVCLAN